MKHSLRNAVLYEPTGKDKKRYRGKKVNFRMTVKVHDYTAVKVLLLYDNAISWTVMAAPTPHIQTPTSLEKC
jgi:hypothetical protein